MPANEDTLSPVLKDFKLDNASKKYKHMAKKERVWILSHNTDGDVVEFAFSNGLIGKTTTARLSKIAIGVVYVNPAYVTPLNYQEAEKKCDDSAKKAAQEAVQKLLDQEAAELVPIRKVSTKMISARFVWQVKPTEDNRHRLKCRLTPRGYEQEPHVHYDPEDIYAGTPDMACVKLLQVLAVKKNKITFHFNAENAFSNVELKEEIFIKLPKGYKLYDQNGNELCMKLLKSLEGLKQSGGNWSEHLMAIFEELGFKRHVKDGKLLKLEANEGHYCRYTG